MKQKEEANLILRIIEYGKDKDGFKLGDMFENLELSENQKKFVKYKLVDTGGQPNSNHILSINSTITVTHQFPHHFEQHLEQNEVRILPNALFSYIDHLEITEARKAAEIARHQSSLAIQISVWALVVSIVLGVLEIIFSD